MSVPDKLYEQASEFLGKHWRSKIGVLLLCLSGFVAYLFVGDKIKALGWEDWSILGCVTFAILMSWHFATRLPRAPRNTIGVAVAIVVDDTELEKAIKRDFVTRLRDSLHASKVEKFSCVVFGDHHARQLEACGNSIKYARRSRCRFILRGNAKIGLVAGEKRPVIRLQSFVTHNRIDARLSARIGLEMNNVISIQPRVYKEIDTLDLEFTAEETGLAARYIVGIASYVSSHEDVAMSIFNEIEGEIASRVKKGPAAIHISKSLRLRRGEIYEAKCGKIYNDIRNTGFDSSLLDNLESALTLWESAPTNRYQMSILIATLKFLKYRDIGGAIKELQQWKDASLLDTTWRYCLAFLFAYRGDMQPSKRHYQVAFQGSVHANIPTEAEEFIIRVMEKEPDKHQLHYCLGMINQYGKGDAIRALEEFQEFRRKTSGDKRFRFIQSSITNQIAELDAQIRKQA